MANIVKEWLSTAMERAYGTFGEAVTGLTDGEYYWKPTQDALTVNDLLPPDGEGWRTYFSKMPALGQLSTIEYKMAHVATCKIMYVEYAFGEGRLQWRWSDLDVPRRLPDMLRYLERAHLVLKHHVNGLTDVDLPVPRKTNWGDLLPTDRILWTLIAHDIYHGAQIRTMRAFHRRRLPI